ncbi:MAG: transcriptional repressor [Bacteroidales bacterium]|nr:transcriptional repressor [Bacteroidales bacterium]
MEVKKKVSLAIANKGLKVTPQRIAVFEAINSLNNHPSADEIIAVIKKHHPNLAVGTVYKTLETFVEKGILKKVKTDKDIMRYDPIQEKHHHLYSNVSERIEDYIDEGLDELIKNYFRTKQIDGFTIEDIKLQISGKFKDE